ncbi:MAG TPA: DUF305 domain-containing protein [Longimicrobiaceae bacterium]|nr:DUF305 domain-containing protein [Longimicrobiaceae bacterium]
MSLYHLRSMSAALLTAATVAACSSGVRAPAPGPAPAPEPVAPAPAPAPPAGGHQHAPAPAPGAPRQPYTAADVHFMTTMIGHHAQAIVMARWADTHGASGSIRTLAGRVINAQQDEIALMQQWLRERGQPVPEPRPGPMRMRMDGVEHDMLMPGMLTEEQMARLDQARGAEFDRLFLTFMIQHHRGAVTMVTELFSNQGAGLDDSVFKLASDVNVDQTTEIARMQRMLADLIFQGGAP